MKFNYENLHRKSPKPLWFRTFLRRYLNRFALLVRVFITDLTRMRDRGTKSTHILNGRVINDISPERYDIRQSRMIYLRSKYDIISVPSYAEGIYHPRQWISYRKIYHPFRKERISLSGNKGRNSLRSLRSKIASFFLKKLDLSRVFSTFSEFGV